MSADKMMITGSSDKNEKIAMPAIFNDMLSSSPDWAKGSHFSSSPTKMFPYQHASHFSSTISHANGHTLVNPSYHEDYTINFFQPLRVSDKILRQQASKTIIDILLRPENDALLRAHLPQIYRLALESPFADVCESFRNFINILAQNVSNWTPPLEIVSKLPLRTIASSFVSGKDQEILDPTSPILSENLSQIFQDVFLQTGRVSHLNRMLAWHPVYFERYFMTFNRVLREPGPLPFHERNYIAILAASRYRCQYFVSLMEQEFLSNGGDPTWLNGVAYVPRKMSNLLQLTSLLAHQPWLLVKEHIEVLVKGPEAWSISELVHAIVLIAVALSISGFCFGIGVTPEVDFLNDFQDYFDMCDRESPSLVTSESQLSTSTNTSEPSLKEDTNKVVELLKKRGKHEESDLELETEDSDQDKDRDFVNAGIEITPFSVTPPSSRNTAHATLLPPSSQPPLPSQPQTHTQTQTQTQIQIQTPTTPSTPSHHSQQSYLSSSSGEGLSRYTGAFNLSHTDFDVKSKSYGIFRVQQYGWKEHGYELVRMFYPDLADLLDEEFNYIFTMTDHTFHHSTDLDTSPFRQAIWYYVQRLKGMCHDDYDYQEVNTFVNRGIKLYVKKFVCFPDQITHSDFTNLGYELRPDEKCHIALLCTNSHRQALLLYGLHTVMLYQNRYNS